MLKGLEVSEINYSWIIKNNYDFRIDSEYFAKKYSHIDNLLARINCKRLDELVSKISDGTHFTPNYTDKGYKFFSAINVSDNYFDIEAGYKYISEKEHHDLYSRCNPEPNDVIMRKVGVGLRKACVVPDLREQFSIFVSVALIKCKFINSYYLSTFLNSKYGQIQLLRFNKGIGQPDLHLEDIARCIIPIYSNNFQEEIEQMVKLAHSKLEESKQLYADAEEQLLNELGLKDWHPKNQNINVKKLSESFLNSGRLDAEYYQSKYDEVEQIIKRNNYDSLNNLCLLINHGMQPPYIENGTMRVFSQKWIKDKEIDYSFIDDLNEPRTSNKFALENADYVCRKNDIVHYSVGANIGFCHTYLSDVPMMPGSFITLIRADENKIAPIYLGVVLNSIIGRMQSEKRKSGTAQPYVYPKDIKEFLIPILTKEVQTEISAKIQKSFALKAESKRLLEEAKLMVEKEIEKTGEISE